MHNTLLDMKGAIRVFCRARPALSGEEAPVVQCDSLEGTVAVAAGRFNAFFNVSAFHILFGAWLGCPNPGKPVAIGLFIISKMT